MSDEILTYFSSLEMKTREKSPHPLLQQKAKVKIPKLLKNTH